MPALSPSNTVVGIDVGGRIKGFHAVALEDGRYRCRLASSTIAELVKWCVDALRAVVIAVDAPCRWSVNGNGRLAERQLMGQGIWCFSTPTRPRAQAHPKRYYDWMLRGETLFQALESSHPLCSRIPPVAERCCVETFPHAITWHLRGGNADAKQKRAQRRQLLERNGIDTDELTNIDWVDAALCALTAHVVAIKGSTEAFGETETGFIIVPAKP